MHTEFENLPNESRIWVHVFENSLNTDQIHFANQKLKIFCDAWTAHEKPLKSSFSLLHNRILILAVDENHHPASGCSIDKSVNFLTQLQQELGNPFLTKDHILFFNHNNQLASTKLSDLEKAIEKHEIRPAFKPIPTWATCKSQWEQQSQTTIAETWLARYFAKTHA